MKICEHCKRRLKIDNTPAATNPEECELCCGLLDQVDQYLAIFLRETEDIKFNTFLLGVDTNKDCLKRDMDLINEKYKGSRNFKQEFTFNLGKKIEDLTKKKVDFKEPELTFTIRQETGDYDIWIKPIFIYGRYRKLRRGIPQSPWIISGKGRENEKSVSEYIGLSVLKLLEGRDYNFFSSGREDVDALMLGNGRPFYVEIIKPRLRSLNPDELAKMVSEISNGGVEVIDIHIAKKEEIDELKDKRFDKLYEVGIILDKEKIESVEKTIGSLINLEIEQQTPLRVLGIRKDKVRRRKIYKIEIKDKAEDRLSLYIKAEAGTYIKEFITGDKGRTNPSLSSLTGVNIKIEYLNVLEVN